MTQNEINSLAASDLLQQAMNSQFQSVAWLLIGAAARLDWSISQQTAQDAWIELWMVRNKDRSIPNG